MELAQDLFSLCLIMILFDSDYLNCALVYYKSASTYAVRSAASKFSQMKAKFFRFLKIVGVGFKARTKSEDQFAGAVRRCKPHEVYKGKRIMYIDEVVKKKQGKK